MVRRVVVAWVLVLTCAAGAHAQSATPGTPPTGQPPAAQPSSTSSSDETRPATTTFFGDTGLWFVPTGEVLPHGKWSVSGYRRGTNYIQGYSNVGDFAGTFAVGIKNRAEVFGSFIADTRIDRDVRPLFGIEPDFAGVIDRYPLVNREWTGDHVGDLYLGVKFNFTSEYERDPLALALRAVVKVPTADKDIGNGTGKADLVVDAIASKEAAKIAEVSGYVGWDFRGSADGFDAPTGAFRWGGGIGVPSRSPVRLIGEVNGIIPTDSSLTLTGSPLIATDGSIAPLVSSTEKLTRATAAVNVQLPKGFFLGGGLSWNVPREKRLANRRAADDDPFADYWDVQVRIGYHPGVRIYVAPPPPPPPPPLPPPPPAPTHTLSVRATANPPNVLVGQSSTVSSIVSSSINCAVTYRWSAPTGTLANPAERDTLWTAPNQEGAVPVTITVTCPMDNKTAADTVNITVARPPVRTYTFEDVHFDFDRYSLRPEATRVLDEAINAMNQDPMLRLTVEGHTCNIGTAEYNLALGDRRANAVRDYLMSRGVSAARLQTISYGEERPKYDNAREETRRLNRRAAMVVRLQ